MAETRRLKTPEAENTRLKKPPGDSMPDNAVLTDLPGTSPPRHRSEEPG